MIDRNQGTKTVVTQQVKGQRGTLWKGNGHWDRRDLSASKTAGLCGDTQSRWYLTHRTVSWQSETPLPVQGLRPTTSVDWTWSHIFFIVACLGQKRTEKTPHRHCEKLRRDM